MPPKLFPRLPPPSRAGVVSRTDSIQHLFHEIGVDKDQLVKISQRPTRPTLQHTEVWKDLNDQAFSRCLDCIERAGLDSRLMRMIEMLRSGATQQEVADTILIHQSGIAKNIIRKAVPLIRLALIVDKLLPRICHQMATADEPEYVPVRTIFKVSHHTSLNCFYLCSTLFTNQCDFTAWAGLPEIE